MLRPRLSLRQQINALSGFAAALATVTMAILVLLSERGTSNALGKQIDDMIARSAQRAFRTCQLAQDFIQQDVNTSLNVGHEALKRAGGIKLGGETETWSALNQYSHQRTQVVAPVWSIGGVALRGDTSLDHPIPVVDEVTRETGETATLFQRVDNAGDMLRVGTSVVAADGKRAIGTYIPAVMPDGTSNTVVKTVLGGQTYRGRAYVVNAWYITAYEPMLNAKGENIGMFYVGVKEDAVASLRDAFAFADQIGRNGSVSIFYGGQSEDFNHRSVIEPTGIAADTESQWLPRVLALAPGLKDDEAGSLDVADAKSSAEAHVDYVYYKPWDWIIVFTADSRDFQDATNLVHNQYRALLMQSLLGGFITLLVGGVVGYFVSKRITDPVADLTINLTSNATQIASSAVQQQSNVTALMASSNQIASAAKEISATSQELLRAMMEIGDAAEKTSALAREGRQGLKGMDGSMHTLSSATGTISSKLATIRSKASRINSVVTVITKVADQTNLLSLNAAIEAEKAGEAGAGFGVVAREIRRLADQSAVATLDIEQIVEEMQQAVARGVDEMRDFSDAVDGGIGAAETIRGQFGEIIERVESMAPRYETVQQGMQNQSVGAKQISEAMWQLTETARQTSDSVNDLNEVSRQLHEAVRILKERIFSVTTAQR